MFSIASQTRKTSFNKKSYNICCFDVKCALFIVFYGGQKILFFCDLKPHAKFGNPTITHSGRKVTRRREREREGEETSTDSVQTLGLISFKFF